MTTDKQELMACPFCGSTNLYERRINGGHGESDAHIACLNCGAMGPSDYGRDHNAAWNNRPELAAVTAERDALKAQVPEGMLRVELAMSDRSISCLIHVAQIETSNTNEVERYANQCWRELSAAKEERK